MPADKISTPYAPFNENELRDVARVLAHVNPYMKGQTHDSIMSHIRDIARANLSPGNCTYVATSGWCITGYWYGGDPASDDWRYKVTVEPSLIVQFLNL
jgi:hypothetical protein